MNQKTWQILSQTKTKKDWKRNKEDQRKQSNRKFKKKKREGKMLGYSPMERDCNKSKAKKLIYKTLR